MWMENELYNRQFEMCETYWEKNNTVSFQTSLPFLAGDNVQLQVSKKGLEKEWVPGGT